MRWLWLQRKKWVKKKIAKACSIGELEVTILPDFEPKILMFACNWCSYAGADLAGISRKQYPPNIRIIRVMCSGRVEPFFILSAGAWFGPYDDREMAKDRLTHLLEHGDSLGCKVRNARIVALTDPRAAFLREVY